MASPVFGRNLIDMFQSKAADKKDRPFLWAKRDGAYRPWSWQQVAFDAGSLCRALRAKGLTAGDRVLLVAENRPEWVISDLAIIMAGGITVPAYTTNTADDHLHLLTDSGAKMALVAGDKLAARLWPAVRQAKNVSLVVGMTALTKPDDVRSDVVSWSEMLALGREQPAPSEDPATALDADQTACLIYTSGTGGKPKGVMLSHRNIMVDVAGAYQVLKRLGLGDEVFLSFLPLSHAYEHTAGLFFPIALGGEIYFAEGVDSLTTNLGEARPTIMTCVPRLYEVMRQRILNAVSRQKGLRPKLFAKAVSLGIKAYEKPGSLSLPERLVNRALDRLVRAKVKDRFGGRMKALVSGGAPLNYDVGLFFTALGLPVYQGYGQTECSPVISCNVPGRVKLKTVGPALPGVEVKIADDGEILIRSDAVMQGYWQDEAATAAAIKNGWLHTGDIGVMDDEGYIQITDRKRDLIVNSGGDNIAPQRVEGIIALEPEIGQVLVYGDRRPNLVALIVPDQEFAAAWARAEGLGHKLEDLVEDSSFQEVIGAAVKRANQRLSVIERVRHFRLIPEPFTIDNGMMTPTLKLKRQVIYRVHEKKIADLYRGKAQPSRSLPDGRDSAA